VTERPATHDPRLPSHLARYRDERPSRSRRRSLGIDGSAIELEIVSFLVRGGLADEEIAEYFESNDLPRYVEEQRSQRWLGSLIGTARENHARFLSSQAQRGHDRTDDTHTKRVTEIQHTPTPGRTYASAALPFLVLRARLGGESDGRLPLLTEWYREIIEVSRHLVTRPIGLSTARDLAGRLRERGYVATERLPGNRQRVRLTEKGRAAARPVMGRWSRYLPVGYSSRPGDVPAPEDAREAHEPAPLVPRPRRRRRAPNAERKRRQRIARERRHERMNGWYRISFRGIKIRYFQLLTAPEDWLGSTAWENLITGIDQEGLPLFSWVAAEEGDDPVRPLVPPEWQPNECVFALALEFERDGSGGFRVAHFDAAAGAVLPKLGVIEQSSFNFFRPLVKAEWEGKILRAKGVGSKLSRRFEFEPVADAPPLETDLTLWEVVASLEQAKHRDLLAALPTGWFYMPLRRKQLVAELLGGQTSERTVDTAERFTRGSDRIGV
jgi:DNA-binding MarR family transcriptional regulator